MTQATKTAQAESPETLQNDVERVIKTVPFHRLLAEKRKEFQEHYAAGDGRTKLTYKDLDRAVDLMASKLLQEGVSTGDRVSLMGPPSVEFLVTFLATVSVGGVWLGLNPKYTTSELEHVISDAAPHIVLESTALDDDQRSALRAATSQPTIGFTEFLGLPVEKFEGLPQVEPDSAVEHRREHLPISIPAALFYTSGTTGKPKGALAQSAALARIAIQQSGEWETPHPATIANLPINHTGCVGDTVSVFQYSAGYLRFIDGFDVTETVDAIVEDEIDTLFQIPTQLIGLSQHPLFADIAKRQLKNVGWGGAALPIELVESFSSFGPRLSIGYGSSETVASISTTPVNATTEQLANTVGVPDPNFDLHLLTQDGEQVPFSEARGLTGEILVKHWTFLPEYLNNPAATKATYTADGFLKMGDVGYARNDGFLSLVGRTKEVFKSGGYNVYPREIEIAIERHPEVRLAAVVRRTDPIYSEVGVAFIEPANNLDLDRESLINALKKHSRSLLANYKVPKNFVIIDPLPTLPNGKIDKVSLGERAEQLNTEGPHHHG